MSNASSSKKSVAKADQYAAVSWTPQRGLLMVVVAFVGSQVLAALVILLISVLLDMDGTDAKQWFDSIPSQFVFVLFAETFTLYILWRFLRGHHNLPKAVGLWRPPIFKDAKYTILGALTYFGVFVLVAVLAAVVFGVDLGQEQQTGFNSAVAPLHLVMAFIGLVILPPIVEEIAFRGVLYGGFRKQFALVPAAVLTAVLFGFLHLFGATDGLLWIAAIDTFVLSYVLCYLRDVSGSIWAGIFVHTLKNSIAYLYLFILR